MSDLTATYRSSKYIGEVRFCVLCLMFESLGFLLILGHNKNSFVHDGFMPIIRD